MKTSFRERASARTSLLGALLLLLGPGCAAPPDSSEKTAETQGAIQGRTSFVSAGDFAYTGEEEEEEGEEEEEEDIDDRSVHENDLYRVLSEGVLLNFNPYRGFEVIDIHDLTAPKVIGRLSVAGTPVEMYVDGSRAVLVLNNWLNYSAAPNTLSVRQHTGAGVLLLDISDLTAPTLLSKVAVLGEIKASRHADDSGRKSVYIASSVRQTIRGDNGLAEWHDESAVQSFDVTGNALVERSHLDMAGSVTGMARQEDVLLVLRNAEQSYQHTDISIVDISDVDGSLALHDEVRTAGFVYSPFSLDFRHQTLRAFSSGTPWGSDSPSHLQTWNASDLDHLVPVDQADFAPSQQILGAVFLDDKAFAVTYYEASPFYSFATDPLGNIEPSDFTIPGRHQFLRSVLGSTSLLGFDSDDTDRSKFAVSLYDITDFANGHPLVAQSQVTKPSDKEWFLYWDHSTFNVLDNAVNAVAPTGEVEKGLVLLPFSGWSRDGDHWEYAAGVKMFTYSGTTVTQRGTMDHGAVVHRTFPLGGIHGANVSDTKLSVFDQSNLDAPAKVGELALAPNYTNLFTYGNYRVRVHQHEGSDWYADPSLPLKAEVVRSSEQAELVAPIVTFDVPVGELYKVGDLLVSVAWTRLDYTVFETKVKVFDLSDPTHPLPVGELVTTALPQGYASINGGTTTFATNKSLSFLHAERLYTEIDDANQCDWYVQYSAACSGQEGCIYFDGYRHCESVNGSPAYCNGGFAQCTRHLNAEDECAPVDDSVLGPRLQSYCGNGPYGDSWNVFQLAVLDLSDPTHPTVTPTVVLPTDERSVSGLSANGDLFVSVKQPVSVDGDVRAYAKYFIRRIDLTNPSAPIVGSPINVPGELLAVHGNDIITRDRAWGSQFIETAVAKSTLQGGLAYLQNYEQFTDRNVEQVLIDSDQIPVVTHRTVWPKYPPYYSTERTRLSILEPADGYSPGAKFSVLSETPLDPWLSLYAVREHHAFFGVPGGVLMADINDGAHPRAQAYYPSTNGLSPLVLDQGEVLIVAGRSGIHQDDVGVSNLSP